MSVRKIICNASLLAALMVAATPGAASTRSIADRLDRHVRTLADDSFEGRLPGTAGEDKTVEYIAREFRKAGLAPGGEVVAGKREWYQQVPLLTLSMATAPRLRLNGETLTQGKEIVLRPGLASAGRVSMTDAPLVFVGYGIDAPDKAWNDYEGVDLKGKIALFLFGEPVDASANRRFGGKTAGKYSGPGHKIAQAVKRGAAGALLIHDSAALGYNWGTIADSYRQARLVIPDARNSEKALAIEGAIQMEAVSAITKAAGMDFKALRAEADQIGFRARPLPGMTLSADFTVDRLEHSSRNVIGRIEGAARPDESIVFISHWDHQGVGVPDDSGDRIYNGAVDNAVGTSQLIEIARALKARKRPDRSVLFIAVTLEEPGLLGSEYYASHPLYPLEKTAAVVALDGAIPFGRARDFSNNASTETDLAELLIEAGKRQGRTYVAEPHPEMFLRGRTDHFPFAKRGVPPVFLLPGEDLLNGGREAGKARMTEYFSTHYHRPSDEYHPSMDFSGNAEDVELLADFAYGLATSRRWPEWTAGAEFKAVRDVSKAERE